MSQKSKQREKVLRAGMDKTIEDVDEVNVDLGFGSQIYWVEYWVNGIYGKTSMCPNCPELFWTDIRRKHNIKTIRQFRFNIIKQIGTSNVY